MGSTGGIKNYKQLKVELEKMKKAPQTVLDRTLSDARTRAPGWISTEVAKQYGIKKSEVGDGKTSTLKIVGKKLPNVGLVYTGRVLTPTHFSMSPKAPKEHRGAYTLKATITKGERETLGHVKKLTKKQGKLLAKNLTRSGKRTSKESPIMLMHTGNTRVDGTSYIPMQRSDDYITAQNKKGIRAKKTVSVPQMIDNKAAPGIQQALDEGLSKRLEHHMKLLEK